MAEYTDDRRYAESEAYTALPLEEISRDNFYLLATEENHDPLFEGSVIKVMDYIRNYDSPAKSLIPGICVIEGHQARNVSEFDIGWRQGQLEFEIMKGCWKVIGRNEAEKILQDRGQKYNDTPPDCLGMLSAQDYFY